MRKTNATALLAVVLIFGAACGGNEQPSAQDVVDEARETAEAADERTEGLQEAGEDVADGVGDVAADVADGEDSDKVDLEVAEAKVEGNTAVLTMKVGGVTIVAANGDTSGKSGHYHAFIDREPVKEGQAIPKEDGIVHSADNPIRIPGLSPGKHEITVVLGDGNHTRIRGDLAADATVTIS
ncbi:MAG TPA: DUF4399 domain-containing protein [Acidimicrobiales bacterium]|nr:DUF4399 domain-containing protein [Acidimicrobiales bacterium]